MKSASPRVLVAKIALGIVIWAVLAGLPSALGTATSGGRVANDVRQAVASKGTADVLVMLDFSPQAFHMRHLQDFGSVGAVTGDTVILRNVDQAELSALGATWWVAHVTLVR